MTSPLSSSSLLASRTHLCGRHYMNMLLSNRPLYLTRCIRAKASARWTGVALALLGISSLFNDVAFYWVVLIFFLQRGPIAPLSEEITEPENKYVILGVAVLLFGLLVSLPYPFPFTNEGMNFDF